METFVYLCQMSTMRYLGMYRVLILYCIWRLSLPFGSLVVLTQPTQPPSHTCGGMTAGSE
jgi:hypothetical protein